MIFKLIHSTNGTGTLSYLSADEFSKETAFIDPDFEEIRKLLFMAEEKVERLQGAFK